MLASVLNAFSNERVFTFLPLLLLAKGIDPTIIGTFALGFTAGSFLGKMACGRFIDSYGSRKVFVFAELLLTILLCILLMTDSLALIVIIALVLGIVTKGTIPVVQTIIIEPVSKSGAFDDIFSINSFVRGITNMLTPPDFRPDGRMVGHEQRLSAYGRGCRACGHSCMADA
ncbi:MFS transporter [Desulfovibrio sp. OttesenSCG-928-G15]|nr:MFS transporter [Desulfovibrio sp. OttesenSCG-928-G15]